MTLKKQERTSAALFLLGFVAGHRLAIVIKFVAGPEQAARHEFEIAVVSHSAVVVAKGGAEHAGLLRAVFVGPDDHRIVFTDDFTGVLLATRQRVEGGPVLAVVI